MATAKKVRRRASPSNESRDVELERLTRQQRADRKGRVPSKRRHVEYRDDGRRRPAARGASIRLSGDELREHVRWFARHEIKRAGLQIPPVLARHFARADDARRRVDQQAVALQRQIAAALDRAERYVEQHLPSDGGVCLAGLAALLAALRSAPQPYAALTALRVSTARLRGKHVHYAEPVVDPDGSRRALIVETLTDEASTDEASTDEATSGEAKTDEAPAGEHWSDRLVACAALALGLWPDSIADDEPMDPADVIAIERQAVKTARMRLRQK